MALTNATVSFDLNQILGADFDPRRTKAYVTTNVENQTLMDTTTGEIRMGDQKVDIAADGTGAWTTWLPGAVANPTSWQETLVVDYARTGQRDRQVRRFGPYTLDGNRTVVQKSLSSNVASLWTDAPHGLKVGDTITVTGMGATFDGTHTVTSVSGTSARISYALTAADLAATSATGNIFSTSIALAALEEEQAVPAEYLTAVTSQLDTYVTAAAGSAASAAGFASSAAESAALADSYIVADLGTSDGQVKALVDSPSSLTSAAVDTKIATRVPDASTTIKGRVELATTTETQTGTDATRAITPAAAKATYVAKGELVVNVKDAPYNAVGDGVADDTAAIQAAIDFVEARNGGTVYIPPGAYLISSTLAVNDNHVLIEGAGGSTVSGSVVEIRDSAATRIVWNAASGALTMLTFTSVSGQAPKVGGGVRKLTLDGMNVAKTCLSLRSWRKGLFEDVFLFAATAEMLFMGAAVATLLYAPYDTMSNRFIHVTTDAKNQTGNTARGIRLTGGQGSNYTAGGNACFNTFIDCRFHTNDGAPIYLEDCDNNFFFSCVAARHAGSEYSLVLGSADQDSTPRTPKANARYNQFHGCELVHGVHARAAQTGGTSSLGNQIYGLNYSNAAPAPTLEAPAGGSLAPTLRVYSSTAAEQLNATAVAIGNQNLTTTEARTAMGTESLRVKSSVSNHVVLESGNGLSAWGITIDNASGDLRFARSAGAGRVQFVGTEVQLGATIRKTADTVRNNTATLANDPHLTRTVVSGGVYAVEAALFYNATTTADLKLGWAYPAGSTFVWAANGATGGSANVTASSGDRRAFTVASTPQVGGGGADNAITMPLGTFTAGADGSLTLMWSQGTAEVSNCTLLAGSCLTVRRIA